MAFEILEKYDEDYDRASIVVSCPLQSEMGAAFELILGDAFRDPFPEFFGSERFGRCANPWLKAALWLSAEIEAMRHLDSNESLWAGMVAKTRSYQTRDASLREFHDLKRAATDPNVSARERLRLLEYAALKKERELSALAVGKARMSVYEEGIGLIGAKFDQFDKLDAIQPVQEDADESEQGVEFETSFGTVYVSLYRPFSLGLRPAGSRGTKSIIIPGHGRIRLYSDLCFKNGWLEPEYAYCGRVGNWEDQLPEAFVRSLAVDIGNQFLAARRDVLARLTKAHDASQEAVSGRRRCFLLG